MSDASFSREKFRELIVFVAAQSEGDASFGATKLHKILFYCDALAFAEYGRSITGASYQKQEHGPTARRLLPILEELRGEGVIDVIQRLYYGRHQKRTVALRNADLTHFGGNEVALIQWVLNSLRDQNAVEVSRLSHEDFVGWQAAEIGEEIPLHTTFVSPEPPNEADINRGLELADQFGWQ